MIVSRYGTMHGFSKTSLTALFAVLSFLCGCHSPSERINTFVNAEKYQGLGLYLFTIHALEKSDLDQENQTIYIQIVNGLDRSILIENIGTEIGSNNGLSVSVNRHGQKFENSFYNPSVRSLWRNFWLLDSISPEDLSDKITKNSLATTPDQRKNFYRGSSIIFPLVVPNWNVRSQFIVDDFLRVYDTKEGGSQSVPINIELLLIPLERN